MYEADVGRLERLCELPYSVETGPRRDFIRDELASYDPEGDAAGNLWVEKEGDTDRTIVVSSHMDTVFGEDAEEYEGSITSTDERDIFLGALDDAVGCWMNMRAVEAADTDHTVYHVFTTNEEYGMTGAAEFRRTLDMLDVEPDLYVVLDVTPGDGYGRSGEDRAGYVDNIPTGKLRDWLESLDIPADMGLETQVLMDETSVYGKDAASVSVGPAVYGDIHSNECYTEIQNVEEAQRFLHGLLEADLDDLPDYGLRDRGVRGARWMVGAIKEALRDGVTSLRGPEYVVVGEEVDEDPLAEYGISRGDTGMEDGLAEALDEQREDEE